MPAFVTHVLFGETVLKHLPQGTLRESIEQNPEAFYWGLQGPDLLFYNRSRSVAELGRRLHSEKTGELFRQMLRHLVLLRGATEYRGMLAYCCGFLCHYALDRNAHPYIYYLQYRREEKRAGKRPLLGIHHRIESDIDTQYYRLMRSQPVRHYRIDPAFGRDLALCNGIARFYTNLLYKLFNVSLEEQEITRSFRELPRILHLCLEPTGLLLPLVSFGERLVGRRCRLSAHIRRGSCRGDVLNLEHRRWCSPVQPSQLRLESFVDICDIARAQALELMQALAAAVERNAAGFCDDPLPFDHGSVLREEMRAGHSS